MYVLSNIYIYIYIYIYDTSIDVFIIPIYMGIIETSIGILKCVYCLISQPIYIIIYYKQS